MINPQLLRLVDIDAIESRLAGPKVPEDAIDEFYKFGSLIFSEARQRVADVDGKLTNMLGWSIATLAFLLLNHNRYAELWLRCALGIAEFLSLACVVVAAIALKTRMWPGPSERDWFKDELWEKPASLRRYHIVSMLLAHQECAKNSKMKADCLAWIEVLLPLCAILVLSVLLFS